MDLLTMRGISKSFDGVEVLHSVNLTVKKGEVHALLGENGAGKSTLMNILAGVFPADRGEVSFDGKSLNNPTIKQTESSGIRFVHQELNLFNDLKVYENLFLGREPRNRFGLLDKRSMIAQTASHLSSLGVVLDPEALVEDLSTSHKQILEIAKALFFDAKMLILDEPTASLNNEEVEGLMDLIRRIKQRGTSFIFISHKLPEILEIADRYTVLRNGNSIAAGEIDGHDAEDLSKLMVGDGFRQRDTYVRRELGHVVLEMEDCSSDAFSHVDMTAKRGEVVGLTGLQGSGSGDVLLALFGVKPMSAGKVKVKGKAAHIRGIHDAMRSGIALLPSNRKEMSVIPDMSILDNMTAAEHELTSLRPVINRSHERKMFARYQELLSIKAPSGDGAITSLSGGNQQKVFIARWLATNADILLFDNPTQGVDIGAKEEIYELIGALARQGKTILINTLEINELKKVADVCMVFYEGRKVATLDHDDISEERVMLYSTGARKPEEVLR